MCPWFARISARPDGRWETAIWVPNPRGGLELAAVAVGSEGYALRAARLAFLVALSVGGVGLMRARHAQLRPALRRAASSGGWRR